MFCLAKGGGKGTIYDSLRGENKKSVGRIFEGSSFSALKSLLIQPSLLKYLWLCSKFDCVESHVLIQCYREPLSVMECPGECLLLVACLMSVVQNTCVRKLECFKNSDTL